VDSGLLDSPTIQALVAARADASTQYQSQIGTRTPEHPEMQRLAARMREIDRNIGREAAKYRSSLNTNYRLAERQEQALGREIASLKLTSLDEQANNVQLGILKRDVDTNRALYDALLQRYKEISAASGSYSNPISIVDEAQVPGSPVRPRPLLNLAIAIAIGVLVSLAVIFLLDNLDDTIRSPEQLQDQLGLPLIGVIPKEGVELSLDEDILDNKSELSEAYTSVQTTLNFASQAGSPTPLLITSTEPSEGKSTTALATALAYARSGKRVLLIDADLRKPSLHRTLGEANATGFSEVLSSQKSLSEVIVPHFDGILHVVMSGPVPPDPASLLSGDKLEEVLLEAQKDYDMVLLDGPPVMGLADAPLIGAQCQATLFVVEAGGAKIRQIKGAIGRLQLAKTRILGSVLTKFDNTSEGYAGEYGYDYKYNYGATSAT